MTEGRQPFTAEIKRLAKGPSTYDPLENAIGGKRTTGVDVERWKKVRAGGRQLRPVMARLATEAPFNATADATSGQLLERRWEFVAGELSLYDEMRKGMSEGKFVTPAEIAASRGVHKTTVNRQLERGEKLGLWTAAAAAA